MRIHSAPSKIGKHGRLLELLAAGCFLLLLGNTHTARAALLAYEPFTNAPGSAIIGSDGGNGFSAPWQSNSSQGTATNTGAGIGYADSFGHVLVSSGGAGFFQGLTTGNSSMQPNRQFSLPRAINGEAATTWISLVIIRQGPTNGSTGNPYARGVNVTFDYPTSSGGANQRLGVGNSSGAATNTLGILSAGGNLRPSSNPPYQFGGGFGPYPPLTNFCVLRVDHIAGTPQQANDNVYLWVNPDLAVEPALNTAATNVLGLYDYSIGLVRVFVGGQDTGNNRPYGEVVVDEIRVGETYADVTPYVGAPAPASLAFTNAQQSAGNIVMHGVGGAAGGTYHLLAGSSLSTPATSWPAIATNTFDGAGRFSVTQAMQPGENFFRIRTAQAAGPTAPSFLSQPVSLTLTQGQTAVFNSLADGTAPLSYQWYFNTTTLMSGQIATNLTLANVQAANAGAYSVRVSNAGGNVTSTQAVLTVLSPPSITTQPQSQSVLVSNNVTFTVVATGTAPLAYQWFYNTNTPIADATNATHGITSATTNDSGAYSVTVNNLYGAVTSSIAALTVNVPNTNGDWFVSTTGSDLNPGTFAAPFATVAKAVSVVGAGQTILVRGGTYFPSNTINITTSGTPGNLIKLWAYPGELPVLDFTNQPYADANRGFVLKTNGNYWHFKGLEIARAGDNAIKVESSHCIFELLVLHHNGDTGLQIGFSHDPVNNLNLGAFITVINCDSYGNYDPNSNGGDADGFAAKLHCGQGIVFIGCRAWENSDDGWDLFETDASIVISNCWTWKSAPFGQGNGNGFKLGGNDPYDSMGTHYAYNCVSFGHKVNGFTQNSHKDGLVIQHCLSFSNGPSGYNYYMEGSLNSGKQNVFKNNVGIRRNPASSSNNFIEDNGPLQQNNSWNLAVTPNTADYLSLLESAAKAPRQPDGSLPTGFAQLISGSDLIDQGINVGQPFNGAAPDLGPYEYQP